jgi:hypothetical protein
MATDIKPKLPIDGCSNETFVLEYGYVSGEADAQGGCSYKQIIPGKLDQSFSVELFPTGSYTTKEYDANRKEIVTSLNPGEIRNYVAGGKSSQVDGHQDSNVESTCRETTAGDKGLQCGKDLLVGVQNQIVEACQNKISAACGGSESKIYECSEGDHVSEHSGNYHVSYEKDLVTSVNKNMIQMVQSGDYAMHVQSGNWDTHIAQKSRLFSASDMLFESQSKITLKVGSSTIVIGPSSIVITADRIDLNP